MKKVGFGVIGLGRHGTRYAEHILNDIPDARLVAVSRRNEEAGSVYAGEKGVAYYRDYRELIGDGRIEAVVVVATPNLNREIAIEAAKAGKHVLVEKPFAFSVKDAEIIIKEAEKHRIKLMVAQTLRYNPVLVEMKKRKEEIGPLHTIIASQRYESLERGWKRERNIAGGGNIFDLGVHMFDFIRWISGEEIKSVYCETDHIMNPDIEDSFVAVLGLKNGMKCVIDSCRYTKSRSGRIELVGEEGQLIGDFVHSSLFRLHGQEMLPVHVPGDIPTVKNILQDFCGSIIHDTVPPITGFDGLKTVQIAEACYLSAKTGKTVSL
jgi:predicted dehydrogenase